MKPVQNAGPVQEESGCFRWRKKNRVAPDRDQCKRVSRGGCDPCEICWWWCWASIGNAIGQSIVAVVCGANPWSFSVFKVSGLSPVFFVSIRTNYRSSLISLESHWYQIYVTWHTSLHEYHQRLWFWTADLVLWTVWKHEVERVRSPCIF